MGYRQCFEWYADSKKVGSAEELLCELVLNGIGGCTIAEAKRNLSAEEVQIWAEYRRRRGTLHLGLRLEQLFAMSDTRNALAAGTKKITAADFLRYHDDAEPPTVTSLEEIAAMFGVPVVKG